MYLHVQNYIVWWNINRIELVKFRAQLYGVLTFKLTLTSEYVYLNMFPVPILIKEYTKTKSAQLEKVSFVII